MAGVKGRGGSAPGRPLSDWQKSAEFDRVRKTVLRRINRRRDLFGRCTATAKSTGLQCGNLACRGRTKCRYHGGATTRGDDWHRPLWPRPSDPRAMEKIHAKLTQRAKNAKERDARLASLSPKLRQKYADWLRVHRPGPAAKRARDREARRQDRSARDTLAALGRSSRATTPAVQRIEGEIAALKMLRDAARDSDALPTTGVFS